MSKHTQRVLDHRYQVAMAKKVKSQDPVEAAIGRQGQAIRRSCIESTKASLISSISTADSSRDHDNSPLSRATSNLTDITVPDTEELIDKLFGGVPKWQPGSFGRDPGSRRNLTYDNILGEGPKPSPPSRPKPSEREEGNHDRYMRLYGSYMRFEGNDKEDRSYNQLSLNEQKQRIKDVQKAKNIQVVLHFPEWKTEYRGYGRYRTTAGLSTEVTNQKLISAMGPTADVLGVHEDVELEGYGGITLFDLLRLNFKKEIQRKLRSPREEVVDGIKVVRGFPIPEERKIRVANVYLNPLTFAAFGDLQDWEQASDWRLIHHHCWAGDDYHEKRAEELDLVETYPQPRLNDDPNLIPKPVGFTKFSGPEVACLPDRHPAIKHSDLEALKPLIDASPIKPRQQPRARPIAITKDSSLGPHLRNEVPARPPMQRRISDRSQKAKKANKKLGKKRVASAIELPQPPKPEKSAHSTVTTHSGEAAKAGAVKNATTSTNEEKPAEYEDSPPAELLVTPPTELSYESKQLQPGVAIAFSKASRNDSGYSSGKPSLTQLVRGASSRVTQPNDQKVIEKPSSTSGKSEIPPIKIIVPSSSPVIEAKSASVEKRNANLPEKSQKRVTWDQNVVSKVSMPRAVAQVDEIAGPNPSQCYVRTGRAQPQASNSNTGAHPMSCHGTAPILKKRDRGMTAELAVPSATNNEPLPKTVQQSCRLAQLAKIPQQHATTITNNPPPVPRYEPAYATAQLSNAAVHKIATIDNLPPIPEQEPSTATDDEAWEEVA
ncbi:MAG: hypothetical protein Q9191_003311 [Dirinaria sp. TL-2023a]